MQRRNLPSSALVGDGATVGELGYSHFAILEYEVLLPSGPPLMTVTTHHMCNVLPLPLWAYKPKWMVCIVGKGFWTPEMDRNQEFAECSEQGVGGWVGLMAKTSLCP